MRRLLPLPLLICACSILPTPYDPGTVAELKALAADADTALATFGGPVDMDSLNAITTRLRAYSDAQGRRPRNEIGTRQANLLLNAWLLSVQTRTAGDAWSAELIAMQRADVAKLFRDAIQIEECNR